MNRNTLERNIMIAELQQKVDELTILLAAANKYNADNKNMVSYDLNKAKERLAEAKVGN